MRTRHRFIDGESKPLMTKEQLRPKKPFYCFVLKVELKVCNATFCKHYPYKEGNANEPRSRR